MGKVILQQAGASPTETVDVQQLAKGIYLIEITTSLQQVATQKLVVQ